MKKKMPSEGLRLGRDSGSIICDTLKKWRFRTGWGGGGDFRDDKKLENKLCNSPKQKKKSEKKQTPPK